MASTAIDATVTLRDVTIAFGDQEVLRAASLAVAAGDVIGIHGANGSGKTSLLRVFANAAVPAVGSRSGPSTCAYVPPTIDPLPLRCGDWLGLFPRARRDDPQPVLRELGFDSDLSKRLGDLSFGNLRKLLLTEALTSGEPLIVIDEFAAGLDRHGTAAAHVIVARLAAMGVTIVLADQQDRAFPLGTRMFEIADQTIAPVGVVTDCADQQVEITVRGPESQLNALIDSARSHGFEPSP